jgi:hypothetical protein
MRRIPLRLLLAVCALVWARPAIAQVQLQGLGGVTNAAARAPFFAGAIGFKITFIEIDVEAGRFRNVLPRDISDTIRDFQSQHGLPVQTAVTVPANYVTGNLRIIWPTGVVQPFAVGGVGVAHITPQFSVDLNALPFGDLLRQIDIGGQNATMALVGGGLRLDFHAVNVEGGYRYVGIFTHVDRADLSRVLVATTLQTVYGAIAIRF